MRVLHEVPAGHPERPEGDDGRTLLERMNGGTHEALALWGLAHVDVEADAHVLDIGCGGGANIERLLELAPEGHVSGLDLSPLSVETSREHNLAAVEAGRCDVREGDSGALPFDDGAFDLVTAFETVYYWDLEAAFPEVWRVLAPGGTFLVCNEDNGHNLAMVEFAKKIPGMAMLAPEEIEDALRAAGFEAVEIDERDDGSVTVVARK